MITEKEGEVAYSLHTQLAGNEGERRQLLAKNAKLLSQLKLGGFRAVLGDDKASWKAYLSQVEVFYTRNEVRTLLAVQNKYVNELGLSNIWDIPLTRLFQVIPVITKENAGQIIGDARLLPNPAWKDRVRELKGKIASDVCTHPVLVDIQVCEECGHKHKK